MQNKVILLTNLDGAPVLIGVESIITVEVTTHKSNPYNDNLNKNTICSKIQSRHAMVTTTLVKELPTKIYELINKQ